MWNKFKRSWQRQHYLRVALDLPKPKTVQIGDMSCTLRKLQPKDLDALLALEQALYEGETPWDRLVFLREIKKRQDRLYLGLFDAKTGALCGFFGMWVYRFEAHITNLSVAPKYQQRGLGTYLLKLALFYAQLANCLCLTLEVRVDNVVALALYQQFGFQKLALLPHYYEAEQIDAFAMGLKLPSARSQSKKENGKEIANKNET